MNYIPLSSYTSSKEMICDMLETDPPIVDLEDRIGYPLFHFQDRYLQLTHGGGVTWQENDITSTCLVQTTKIVPCLFYLS